MLSPTPGQKCVKWCDVKPGTSRPDDILKQITPTLTPHYFRHNYVTLCRASVNMEKVFADREKVGE